MTQNEPKKRMSDLAYEGLRSAIIKAELMPGAPIDERQMMAKLDVGRTPLREALQRLAQEDLVLAVPQRGYFVSSTSASDFFQLQEFRLHTEILAARMAAVRISSAQLARLATLIEEVKAGVAEGQTDIDWNLELDERMHLLIAEASGNTYLAQALKRLYVLSVRSLYVSRVPVTLLSDELGNYAEIFEALNAHDPDAAESAIRQHLAVSAVQLVQATPQRRATQNKDEASA